MRKQRSTRRRGFVIAEMIAALAIFAVAATLIVQLAVLMQRGHEKLWQTQVAGETLANIAEDVRVRPWQELSSDELEKIELPAELLADVPEAKLHVEVAELAGPPNGKQIVLRLLLDPQSPGQELSIWRFQAEEQK